MKQTVNNQKLQELVSNSVANAMATVSNSKEKATTPKVTEPKKKVTIKKKTPSAKEEAITQEVTKQQNAAIVEQVISNREVKYLYPKDVTDTLTRKRWRQQVRNELHKLERTLYRIKDQNSKEFKEAKQKYEDFQAKVLKPSQTA